MENAEWVAAPRPLGNAGHYTGVYLYPGERVEWIFANNRVVGYVITNYSREIIYRPKSYAIKE